MILTNTPEDLSNNDLIYLKHAMMSLTTVELSFSRFKNIFRENRRSFLFENVSKSSVVNCNSSDNVIIIII